MRITSLTPLATNLLVSEMISSIGFDLCLPLMEGIAQKVQRLAHPSEIFKYA